MRIVNVIIFIVVTTISALSDTNSTGEHPLSELERLLDIKLPSSSKVKAFQHETGWMDDTWLFKVTVPRSALTGLLDVVPFKAAIWKSTVDFSSQSASWWKPNLLKKCVSTQIRLQNGKVANVYYGYIDNDPNTILYIQIYET